MDLSIVIPVYNSERIVPELVRRIAQAMASEHPVPDYEVILVNDGSPDRSWPTGLLRYAGTPDIATSCTGRSTGTNEVLSRGAASRSPG